MECCEGCGRWRASVRWEEWDNRFFPTELCDECNFARPVPLPSEKPSWDGILLSDEERKLKNEWGELPQYWWRQRWV